VALEVVSFLGSFDAHLVDNGMSRLNAPLAKKIIAAALVLIFFALLGFLQACAQAPKRSMTSRTNLEIIEKAKAPPQRTSTHKKENIIIEPTAQNIVGNLKNFELTVLSKPAPLCPGPKIYLGSEHELKLILEFNELVPPVVKPKNLFARIANLETKIPFVKKISEKQYVTSKTKLDFLKPGLEIFSTGISIFYTEGDSEYFLGERAKLARDTIPPPKPIDVSVVKRGENYFTLEWKMQEGEIRKFNLEKLVGDNWVTIQQSLPATMAHINLKPAGRVRLGAIDCAGNPTPSDDVWPSYVTVKRKYCSDIKAAPKKEAIDLIQGEFLRRYVQPELTSRSSLSAQDVKRMISQDPDSWLPSEIDYSIKQADFDIDGNKTCSVLTGRIGWTDFEEWINEKVRGIEDTRRKGIRVRTEGRGSIILAEYLRSGAVSRGYEIYSVTEFLPYEPLNQVDIRVILGQPSRLPLPGVMVYSWDVEAIIHFNGGRTAGTAISFTAHDVPEIDDNRIYGETIDEALNCIAEDCFKEQIAMKFMREFFRRFDALEL